MNLDDFARILPDISLILSSFYWTCFNGIRSYGALCRRKKNTAI